MGLSRRGCLGWLGCAAGGAMLGGVGARLVCALGNQPERWLTFSESEALTLEALVEQIVPRDEACCGAREAGCAVYIDRVLQIKKYVSLQALYHENLALLASRNFMAVSFENQMALLMELEKSTPSFRKFFETAIDQTMQGFYGSPRHGGNKGFVSYRMMGLDVPRLIGR